MKRKRVLSVHYDGKVYSIYEEEYNGRITKKLYRTFIGRKRLDLAPWYTFTDALAGILCEIRDFKMMQYKSDWL